jgi:hypothetical protein
VVQPKDGAMNPILPFFGKNSGYLKSETLRNDIACGPIITDRFTFYILLLIKTRPPADHGPAGPEKQLLFPVFPEKAKRLSGQFRKGSNSILPIQKP